MNHEFTQDILTADAELQQMDAGTSSQDMFISTRIPVTAGQVIGKVQGFGLLGMLTVDMDITLSGLVKYELVPLKGLDSEFGFPPMSGPPLITENDESQVAGVLLVQMIDDRTIKMEVFPDKTAAEVSDFSNSVRTYHR